jgi:Zn-dependent protease
MLFFVFAAFTLYLSWLDGRAADTAGTWSGVACLGILLASVIVHELGHVLVANRLGATVDEVVLAPLGGIGPAPAPLDPQSELVTVMAGPLANLGACFTAAFALALQGDVSLVGLMNPFVPEGILVGSPLLVGMKLTFWVNWILVLLNLIPAYPFDGGRAMRATLMVLRPGMEYAQAVFFVAKVAKLTALGLLVLAWIMRNSNPSYALQTWLALVVLAIFVFFSAKKEEAMAHQAPGDDAFLGYDFSAGYTSLERSGPRIGTKPAAGPLVRWWKRRQEQRDQRRRELESLEDNRVDEILTQLHTSGLESLTSDDRELLNRVSARYRKRPR